MCFLATQFLDNVGKIITDYKFWCFNGVPKIVYMTCKEGKVFENFYDWGGFQHFTPRGWDEKLGDWMRIS